MAKAAAKASGFEEDQAAADADDSGAMFENDGEGLLVDLSKVEGMKFEVLPKGTYNGIIDEAKFEMSKSSNKPMWNLQIAVTDEGEHQNRKQFTILSFSEKALPGTKVAIATFAPELLEGPFNPKSDEVVGSLTGRRVKFKVKHEEYQGEPQSRISRWYAPEADGGFIG